MRGARLAEDFFQLCTYVSHGFGAVNFGVFGVTRLRFFGVVADQSAVI